MIRTPMEKYNINNKNGKTEDTTTSNLFSK